MAEQRLQKILSQAGIASRRHAEELIQTGQVTVNGEIVTVLGSKADLDHDTIRVNGRLIKAPKRLVYIALNKPKGCVTTVSDPEGRPTVMDLLHGIKERVFPIGRLDYASEGLLLFTNDGEFAHRLTAPSSHIVKMYQVKANGALTEEQEEAFRAGVPLHGRKTAPSEIQRVRHGANPWYEVQIAEGRQNQIRMMFRHFGRLVEKLRRTRIGFLELDLAPGRYRLLTDREVAMFRKTLGMTGEGEAVSEPTEAVEAKPASQDREPSPGFKKPTGIQSAAGFRPVKRAGGKRPAKRVSGKGPAQRHDGPRTDGGGRAKRPAGARPGGTSSGGKRPSGKGPAKRASGKPSFGKGPTSKRVGAKRPSAKRSPFKTGGPPRGGAKPTGTKRPGAKRPGARRPGAKRPGGPPRGKR